MQHMSSEVKAETVPAKVRQICTLTRLKAHNVTPRTAPFVEFAARPASAGDLESFRSDCDEAPENDPPTSPTTDQTKWVTRTSPARACENYTLEILDRNADGLNLQTWWCFRH